jgi:hypothetical protein
VTSSPQRMMNQVRIWMGSVAKKAVGTNSPKGSRTKTQRIGSGSKPGVYHKAGPVTYAIDRGRPPYQVKDCLVQIVVGSVKT